MTGPAGEPYPGIYTGPPPTRPPGPGGWVWQPVGPPPVAWQPAPFPYGPPPVLWQPAPFPYGPPPAAFPQVRMAPPAGTPPHDVPQPFLLAMRSRDWSWWRPVLGLLLLLVVYFVVNVVVAVLGLLGALAAGADLRTLPSAAVTDLTDPAVLLLVNVSLILAIPCVWMVWAVAHGMRIGWSSSVLGRVRWRLFRPFALLAFATIGGGVVVSFLVGLLGGDAVSSPVRSFGWLLAVVVFTTPLQAAAEEYLFRGYLSQSIAGWIRRPLVGAIVAAVVSAALFSAAHGPTDVPTFLDRFAFGLAASAVVWLTGGLEAAIAAHTVNNVVVFVIAGALGQGTGDEAMPGIIGLLYLLITVVGLGGYVFLVARSRAALRPDLRTAAQDLRAPVRAAPAW